MFYLLPVKKLSTHNTSCPRESRRSQRWEPRKPAPPVTTTFFRIAFCTEASLSLPERVSPVSAARHPQEGRLCYETSSASCQVRLPEVWYMIPVAVTQTVMPGIVGAHHRYRFSNTYRLMKTNGYALNFKTHTSALFVDTRR